ncbi:MAG: sulfurtransferase TusA family protein [Deltaproteobacteria bacterium]|nr:sulfurtransferase TusA family protein [Deltaproteobacteria bacterium]
MAEIKINAQGLKCPMPIVKISKGIKLMSVGDVLFVTSDDPAFKEDVKAFCNMTGNTLTAVTEAGGVFTAQITKK